MKPTLPVAALFAILPVSLRAQSFSTPASSEPAAMAALAREVLAAQPSVEGEVALNTRFRLQLAAQDYPAALETMKTLRALRKGDEPTRATATRQHELYARTRLLEAAGKAPEAALNEAFVAMARDLDDPAVYQFSVALRGNVEGARQQVEKIREELKGKTQLDLSEALKLLAAYQTLATVDRLLPKAAALMAEEEGWRYVIDEDARIRTQDGATICAVVVRPRKTAKLPTAFEFTIYANESNRGEAIHSAANGFVGVVANSRGKRNSPDAIEPYEHDGADAAATIAWIARQPWSDGQVGMYGGSYDGFTQWAAAKHRPKALKAIMPSVPVAPGVGTPMEGGVFLNSFYKWIPYVTHTKLLDETDYNDWKRWNGLDWAWFESGRPYRELPDEDGHPNPLWLRWLSHPTYDRYWQVMIPYGKEFADLNIPVLTTTGYFDGCSISALYYFTEHTTRRKGAEHYFVIGPYDHIGGQRRSQDVVQGYAIDPAARIDIEALRYQWLNHVLRGGPKPALLKDRVNYQVMGADTWKHSPTVAAMANGSRIFHLDPASENGMHRLSPTTPAKGTTLPLKVDLAERKTLSFGGPAMIQDKEIDTSNGLAFASAPLTEPLEVSGCFSGRLAFVTNKKDVDLSLQLYEQTADGRCLFLSHLLTRASLLRDRQRRQLLTPGKLQTLAFSSERLTSRRLAAGSRVVFLLSVPKQPRAQVNYGTGKDVSVESIADAGEPLQITLRGVNYLRLPIFK